MNKWFLTGAAVLLTAVSCNLKNTFSETNAQEFLNVKDGALVNDNLIPYHVKNDATDRGWQSCERIVGLFDLTDGGGDGYDIDLKSYDPVSIYTPAAAGEEEPIGDPLYLAGANISGGYLNLGLQWYSVAKSTANHQVRLVYKDNPATQTWTLTVIHDADGETEDTIDDEDKKVINRYYSIPIYKMIASGETRALNLTLTYHDSQDKENPVKQRTVTLYSAIRF